MRKKTILALTTVVIILATTIAAFLSQSSGTSQMGAEIYVDPNMIKEQAKQPPFTFYIYISIYNVTNMVLCEFNLSYTPGIFVVNQISKIKVQDQYPSSYTYADDVKGYIYVKLTYGQPITLPEENARLLEIQFTAINYGSTVLDLHNVSLEDANGDSIPYEAEDGFVWILKHDIAMIDCITSTDETYVGRLINISVTAKNEGDIAENFTVTIYADDQPIVTLPIINLAPNETVTQTVVWNTSSNTPSLTPYKIRVEAEPVPYEMNMTNNIFIDGDVKLKIVGDVNGDGTVDITDLQLWDSAFNSKPGDSNWNPQADINGDGVVDKEDGMLIIQNYKSSLL